MRRMVVTLAVVLAMLAPSSLAFATVRIPETLADRRPAAVGAVEPGFPIDHLAVLWPTAPDTLHDDGHDHDDAPHGEVRFRVDGRWGLWTAFIEDGVQAPGHWASGLVAGADADAYQVRGVPAGGEVVAVNTTDGPTREVRRRPASSAGALPSCMSRYDWGADESLGSTDRTFAPVQVMTVHHTATANGDPDPSATLRAIQRVHVTERGFDDVGYQFLIDEAGLLYEGRRSDADSQACQSDPDGDGRLGDGTEFGHDVNGQLVTGAHVGGYNTGNAGVALFGTFTEVSPTPAARAALVDTLADLSRRHGLDPQGTTVYRNSLYTRTVRTLSGHGDWASTECPGAMNKADMDQLRADVADAAANSPLRLVDDPLRPTLRADDQDGPGRASPGRGAVRASPSRLNGTPRR